VDEYRHAGYAGAAAADEVFFEEWVRTSTSVVAGTQ